MEQRIDFIMLLLVLLLQLFYSIPSQAFISITKAECTSLNLKHAYFKHCEMKTNAKGETFINLYAALRDKTPMDDIMVNLSVFKVTRTYSIPIINETLDYCAFMKQTAVAKMFSFITNHLNKFTNANHSCPYGVITYFTFYIIQLEFIELINFSQHDIIYYGLDKERILTEIPVPKGDYILQLRVANNKSWKVFMKFYAIQK
ncbi:hypothetical protein KR044_010234 [Drosophila immigrans]|nr:hypothetical protein KR044_010234 [Drosophila immigrans]